MRVVTLKRKLSELLSLLASVYALFILARLDGHPSLEHPQRWPIILPLLGPPSRGPNPVSFKHLPPMKISWTFSINSLLSSSPPL